MFGVRLIVILALMGGIIAYIADKLGSKIGKKRLTIFGLRPHKTSVLLTVLSGILIAACTIGVLAVASQNARTALFGMDKLQKEMASLTEQKKTAQAQLDQALAALKDKNVAIAKLDEDIKSAQNARDAAEDNLAKAQGELATAREQYAAARSSLIAAHSEVRSCSPRHDAFSFIYLYLPYPNGKAVQTTPACTAFSCPVIEMSCLSAVFSI